MSDVLQRIIRRKAEIVTQRASALPLGELSVSVESAPPVRGFLDRISQSLEANRPAVIAEIKKASPSKGVLRESFDPEAIAQSYASAGASCLSVLTDEDFFQGHDSYLKKARAACDLPVLRKDFMIDAWQIYESRVLGADCILLICSVLGDAALFELSELARELGMDVLVEVHNQQELERALRTSATLIGVNNRNLATFETDIETTLGLLPGFTGDGKSGRILVSESGIHRPDQVQVLRQAGVNSFLVGEAFMRQPDPGLALRKLFEL